MFLFSLPGRIVFLCLCVQLSAYANQMDYPPELKQKLLKAYQSQPANYRPRSQHQCANKQPCYTNRLILESSPYLLQHAHNPVNWFSWGKEALEKARRENKPIFLSVGYAACHWCHVMEEESFDNEIIAKLLNEHFIAIKVDRERRPDIDELYGNAMNYFVGRQGWPMSLFLTPDGKPFDGGGYYPFNKFRALLIKNAHAWKDNQPELELRADKVMQAIYSHNDLQSAVDKIDDSLRRRAIKSLLSIVDNYQGGFGEGSKFPREPWLYLLLNDSYGKPQNNDSLTALNNTLQHMARGGIYDQLGGGFHRYTVDPNWKVPHFEKMLYNQALLIPLYIQADVINPDRLYRHIIRQTADFMLNEMQAVQGGFYASLDADNGEGEGRYYLWSLKQWRNALTKDEDALFTEMFDVDEYGEMEDESNVLYLFYSIDEYAKEKKLSEKELITKLELLRSKLLKIREQRPAPAKDKKIIMGWNGLAISALARASMHLQRAEYLQAAVKAADFIWENMQSEKGFYRIYFNGKASSAAQLEDYAFYLQSLISLYDIEQNKRWLKMAEQLFSKMLPVFWDEQQGGFYNVAVNDEAPLPVRPKTAFDKMLPSGNGIVAQSLVKLYRRTGNEDYLNKAERILAVFAEQVAEVPSAYASLLIASRQLREGSYELPAYGAHGHLRIDAYIRQLTSQKHELMVNIKFDDLWHINSHTPDDKQLIPTSIQLKKTPFWQLAKVNYPPDEKIRLGFSRQPLALYQHEINISADLIKFSGQLSAVVDLRYQACNDEICLPPEKNVLYPRLVVKNQ